MTFHLVPGTLVDGDLRWGAPPTPTRSENRGFAFEYISEGALRSGLIDLQLGTHSTAAVSETVGILLQIGIVIDWSPFLQISSRLDLVLVGFLLVSILILLTLRIIDSRSKHTIELPRQVRPPGGGQPTPGQSSRDDHSGESHAFLQDEERVIKLLSENGGTMPQQQVVQRTEWSKSKVSRLLSRMEENGQIRKISHGRENSIELMEEQRIENFWKK